jgi:hypothetical protein
MTMAKKYMSPSGGSSLATGSLNANQAKRIDKAIFLRMAN